MQPLRNRYYLECDKLLTLQLEHKNEHSTQNQRSNLELICPNCHTQTPTYGSKNKGNGRKKRRKVYLEKN